MRHGFPLVYRDAPTDSARGGWQQAATVEYLTWDTWDDQAGISGVQMAAYRGMLPIILEVRASTGNPSAARSSDGSAAADATVETAEDTAYTFRPSDFGFSDEAKRDRNSHVTIATLPQAGSLSVDGSPARQHQIVDKTDIGSGALVFTPAANAHGDAYASFEFRTYNGRTESAAATMTVDVTPVNDPATGAAEIAGTAEAGRTATAAIGSVSDPDGTENAEFAYRWIRVADGAETPIEGATGQRYVLGADDVGHRVRVEVSFTDDSGTAERAESAPWPAEGAIAAASGLTATFSGVPESHDGSTAFTFELHFSEEPPGLSYRTVRGSLLETGNAQVQGARRLTPGSNLGWEITVRPGGPGEVSLTLPVRECSRTNAICVGGRALGGAVTTRIAHAVATPEETPQQASRTPLTAEFRDMPAGHDGSAFTFELRLSEDVDGLSYRTVRDGAFSVTGGAVTNARRLVRSRNQRWEVHVRPSGYGDVSIALNATRDCSASGAICTRDGRMQSTSARATVQGPVTLSVADARVREAQGAALAFTVSLNRAAVGAVSVDYATRDGSATAGDDYTETSGTLAFAAGETSRTVQVPVLDDAHDEGEETLTLALSNPSPSSVKLADASATGTIENDDAMPQAWLARFGRTVAEQVLDAVESRMRAARTPGVEVSVAGERIGWQPGAGAGLGDAARDGGSGPEDSAVTGPAGWPAVNPALDPARSRAPAAGPSGEAAGLADWLRGERIGGRAWSRPVTERDLLFGSSFALAAEAGGPGSGGGAVALWGRGTVSRFDGRDGDLSVDGEVASGMIGADWSRGRAMAGLIVGHSMGDGGYRAPSVGGVVSSTLTGLYPWDRYALSERVELWGAAGYGEGTLTLTPEGQDALRTDLDLWMAAAGLRGVLIDGGGDGLSLAVKTDAMTVTTSTDAIPGLAASEGGVTRLRLGLEGALPIRLGDGSVLTPSMEIGVRHDGGDAETGFGADIGGGIAWRDAGRGLAAELRGRGLLTHESKGFRDRGLSGSLNWEPVEGGRGPRVTLSQTVGGASSGGADALLGRGTLAGLAANENGGGDLESRRLEARFGYGFAAFGGGFTWTPEVAVVFSNAGRAYSLGWRLVRGAAADGSALELSFEARRRESSAAGGGPPEHGIGVRLGARF